MRRSDKEGCGAVSDESDFPEHSSLSFPDASTDTRSNDRFPCRTHCHANLDLVLADALESNVGSSDSCSSRFHNCTNQLQSHGLVGCLDFNFSDGDMSDGDSQEESDDGDGGLTPRFPSRIHCCADLPDLGQISNSACVQSIRLD